jgi:hypothetical protein
MNVEVDEVNRLSRISASLSFLMISTCGEQRHVPVKPGRGQAMPDDTRPQPEGWNRFTIEVTDSEYLVT